MQGIALYRQDQSIYFYGGSELIWKITIINYALFTSGFGKAFYLFNPHGLNSTITHTLNENIVALTFCIFISVIKERNKFAQIMTHMK